MSDHRSTTSFFHEDLLRENYLVFLTPENSPDAFVLSW